MIAVRSGGGASDRSALRCGTGSCQAAGDATCAGDARAALIISHSDPVVKARARSAGRALGAPEVATGEEEDVDVDADVDADVDVPEAAWR